MFISSDWHLHSVYSHDSRLTLQSILEAGERLGLQSISVTDHVNYNDAEFLSNLAASVENVGMAQREHPFLKLGVELTPLSRPHFDYIAENGIRTGYTPKPSDNAAGMELAVSKEALVRLGVRYAIGASHWRVDYVGDGDKNDLEATVREWYRQQLWMACDERVTILGHPWYHGAGLWYADFSVIPHSMQEELIAALKENGKYVECNSHFFCNGKTDERFRRQYAEFLREIFEAGIPITYGSDCHNVYSDHREQVAQYLIPVGFREGDIGGVADADLW